MSTNISIEPATLAHADYIGMHMRQSDAVEVMASHGHNPVEACRHAMMVSDHVFAGMADGVPFYLFGMREGTVLNHTGYIWGLGTDELLHHAKSFWPASRNFVAYCRGHVDRLENFVHIDNHVSIAWLRRLGFRFDDPAPYGVAGDNFLRFYMEGGFLCVSRQR